MALYKDDCATLEDLREAVTMLEDAERIARRVLGGAHPITSLLEQHLRNARDAEAKRAKNQKSRRTFRCISNA